MYHSTTTCLAQRTTFCRVSRGDCDYQYFVGARDEEFVVAVMEAGK